MNNIYKSKWSESTQTWVACSELARGKCKSNGLKIVAAVALALASTSVIAATSNANNININTNFNSDIKNEGLLSHIDMNIKIGDSVSLQHLRGNILQAGSGNVNVTIRKHFFIEGNIKSIDTPNGEQTGTLTIENEHGIIEGGITNEGSGDIIINNQFLINSDIISTQGSTGNITINNKDDLDLSEHRDEKDKEKYRAIDGKIINQGSGIFEINNESKLRGDISNTGFGTIILNNSGKSTGNIINDSDSASSRIEVTNDAGKTLESTISNIKAGTVELTNNGETTGAITNSGAGAITLKNNGETTGAITNSGAGAITLKNSGETTGAITNLGAGAITLKNSGETTGAITNLGAGAITLHNSGTSTSEIKNTADGKITLDNSGTSTGNIINSGSASSLIDVTNEPDTELESTISNTQAGKIILTNKGKTTGAITNSGTGAITLGNSGTSTGNITNSGIGAITLNNSGTSTSEIKNTADGKITLNNSGTSTGNIINSGSASSLIDVTNEPDTELESTISNTQAGKIILTNKGKTTGAITNSGTGAITLGNSGTSTGNITNSGIGAITLNNSGTSTSEIKNTADGKITLNNSGTSTGNIINSGSASSLIDVTNEPDTELESTISNTQAGKIILTNKGKTTGAITNSGTGAITLGNSGTSTGNITNSGIGAITLNNSGTSTSEIKNTADGKITLNNSGTSTGNIINSGSASSLIDVTNEPDTELESTISNTQAGKIILTNKGKTTGAITNSGTGAITLGNSGTSTGNITNSGIGAITLNNSGTSTSEIKNTADGKITLNNSGTSTGNIINSGSASSLIDVTNEPDTELESTISNTQAGKIILTNKGKTTGAITNSGTGAITLGNSGTSTGNIINSGSDDSSIHINNEGLLKSKIANMGSGQVTLINSGISDNTEIINAGDGGITVRNNKTLNNTNIINEMHGTGNISFTNNGEFKGNLINNTGLGLIDATNTKTGIFTGTTDNSVANGKINLINQGSWINTGDSTLSQLTNTGIIEFSKIPLADINDENKYHTITVQGNYTGGGTIYVNTLWNDDSTSKNGTGYTDRVNIGGDVTGDVTTVATREGIYGDITQKEIPITHPKTVIHVDGQITGQGFEGTSATKNAGEAQLRKIDQSLYGGTGTDYAWTLTAKTPTNPAKPTPPKEVPIYAEPVSGYVQMPTVNMELGFTTIGTLYERRSDNQTYNITGTNNTALGDNQQQTWGRVLVKHLDKNGKQRLDTVGNQSVLQIGHDFILDKNNKTGTRRHIGAYVSYGHNENDFRDQYRAKNGYVVDDHYTGKGRTDAVSVGGYGTFYANNGSYIDLVGQVSYLRNKYNARSNESVHQNGWGAAVSAEAGKSFTVYGNNWFVEPQVQLAYQYLSLDNFNDGIRHIDQHNPSALRGRVGMRFGYNGATTDNLPPSSFYGITNIWHDFVNPKSVDIGRDSLKEEYAKTWGEVGVGIQLPITRQSHFYGDVRYEKNFGSAKHKGFKGTLGYKYTWL
ncbi:hypothetical protein BGI32_07460 [Snodgrassella alvi]|uniref:Autotransporter domain-containing protein n=1 Tax=Snodgrassella alvi TaxID=1196083 RepID=A0A2N9WT99_9NEIS|nr:autotransporter outer membrane beta-barrel domain-containing protein [Snodgrassella alvi]PIT14559.1 hypothetical protein BGI32_07460 [Snodgrassella alvi]